MVLNGSPPPLLPPLPVVVLPAKPQVQSSCDQVGPAFRSGNEGRHLDVSKLTKKADTVTLSCQIKLHRMFF